MVCKLPSYPRFPEPEDCIVQEASELWSDQHAWFPGSPEIMSPQQPASPIPVSPLTEAKQPISVLGLPHIWQASAGDQSGATLRAMPAKLPDGANKASLSLTDQSRPLKEPDGVPQLEHGMKQDRAWTIAAKVVSSQVGTVAEKATQHSITLLLQKVCPHAAVGFYPTGSSPAKSSRA